MNKFNNEFLVILTGTDPKSKKGGIGYALPGYISALENSNILYESIPTYFPDSYVGKYFLFLLNLPTILRSIKRAKNDDRQCIVYSHAGGNISLLREGVVALMARFAGAKTVMQIHSYETIGYLKSPIKSFLFNFVLIGVQRFFVLSPWWKKNYLNMGVNKPIDIISNPMPTAWEKKAHENLRRSNNMFNLNVLVMTRIVSGKRVDLIIEAVRYFPEKVKVNIAGDGPLLNTLRARVKKLMLEDKVIFHGWVAGTKKQELIDAADVFCHPTQFDAMPMNILEAMAHGLPIVALNWGPIPDLVPNNKAGILIGNADPIKIADAIKKLESSKLRENMGNEAKRWVLENYTSETIGIKLHEAFTRVVSQ